jgi:NAD(P)-dependent dehydrogenase (short-subunit alcohol dehydrogenase family)
MGADGRRRQAATKAAVESLTRSWALELAPAGIRVDDQVRIEASLLFVRP